MPTTSNAPDTGHLNTTLASNLNELMAAVRAAGGTPAITSGYRTAADQQRIIDNPSLHGSNPVAPVGTSLHEKGLAADVTGDAHTTQLLHTLAPKFGLAFPFANDPVHLQLAGGVNASTTTTGTGQTNEPGGPVPLLDRFSTLAGLLGNPHASTTTDQTDTSATAPVNASDVGALGASDVATNAPIDSGGSPTTPAAPQQADGANGIDEFMKAISGQESGGNYGATNKDSGASGKYQIMPSNWPSWSKEAGLGANAAQSPANQEAVAKFKMQQYYQQFGNWHDVAVAWYAGPGAVGKVKSIGNAGQGGYPTINQYADQVTQRAANG